MFMTIILVYGAQAKIAGFLLQTEVPTTGVGDMQAQIKAHCAMANDGF